MKQISDEDLLMLALSKKFLYLKIYGVCFSELFVNRMYFTEINLENIRGFHFADAASGGGIYQNRDHYYYIDSVNLPLWPVFKIYPLLNSQKGKDQIHQDLDYFNQLCDRLD